MAHRVLVVDGAQPFLRRRDAEPRVDLVAGPEGVVSLLQELRDQCAANLDRLGDEELQRTARVRWPMKDRPFADLAAWLNVELMKNAAEIGFVRFLYAAT